jgi:predicted Ser/Thr protein kinase
MTGQVMQGRYEILGEIGHGGMGVVYRARQISLDRIVALKVLSANLVDDEDFRERFRQEAKIIARLTHPNIVHVYDIYDIEGKDGWFCIVMEFLEGRSLRELLREAGPLPIERAVAIAEQIATGLAYAHSQGIIHRDIKPDNIMMLANDQIKIMDFGIARLRGSTLHTQTGVSMGTPQFMSPEQASGKSVDARSDLYSLCVVLYGMATGQLPFSGDSPVMIALKHIQEPPPRPSQINPAIPPALDSIILKGLAKRPEDRFQNAEELQQVLGRFDATTSVTVPAAGDETYVSTPVPAPIIPQPVASGPWDASAEAARMPPVRRHFNWGWIVAALPGLVALAIVLYVVIYRPEWMPWRRGPAELREFRRVPFEKELADMRNMKMNDPDRLRRLIEGNEEFLRLRATEAIRREMKAARLAQVHALRNEIEDVIFPYLTDEQQRQWTTIGPAGQGVGPPYRKREGPARPGPEELLNSRIDESKEPDPRKAEQNYKRAKADAQDWEKTTSPTRRTKLFGTSIMAYKDSIRDDPKNWLYHWEFSQFLANGAQQSDLGRSFQLICLKTAIDQIDSATALCLDPAQRKKMEEEGDALRQRLGSLPSGQDGSPRPGGPARVRERMGRPDSPINP